MSIISKIKSVFKSSQQPAKTAAPVKKATPAAEPAKKETAAPAAAVNPKEVETLLTAIKERRTIYSLKPELPAGVTLADIKDITQAILKDTPSAFNSQPNKVIILTGEAHKQAYGTILFIVDDDVTKGLQEGFPAWAAAFPDFAVTSNGAVQISTWTALSQLPGFGAHLQHYNFLKGFLGDKIGENYTVQAQLVFGTKVAEAGEKTYNDHTIPVVTEL
ncbi:unnamed protein product [Hanseniaspora opuntiae]